MTLADSDTFAKELSVNLGLEFYDRFARSVSGNIALEWDLRQNRSLAARPVNLKGHLPGPGVEINIAEFRSRIRAAARSNDPVGQLQAELANAMPETNIASVLLQAPCVRRCILESLDRI